MFQTVIYGTRHQHAADEALVHSILWTDKACFMRAGVLKGHKSHLCPRDSSTHAVRERGSEVSFSLRVWAGVVRDTVLALCLLPHRVTAQRYRDLLGLLQRVPLAVRLWFQHDAAPAHCGEGGLGVEDRLRGLLGRRF